MNTKHRWIAAAGGCLLLALGSLFVFWPHEVAPPEQPPVPQKSLSRLTRPLADFERATLLTATEPSSDLPHNPLELPPPYVEHSPLQSNRANSAFSDDPPISFMPERLSLAEHGQWQNGWDEPVTDVGQDLLPELPDLSAAADWPAPSLPIAEPHIVPHELAPPSQPVADIPIAPTAPPTRITTDDNVPTYSVKADDTLWTISQKVYGTGALFAALGAYNRRAAAEPIKLEVGQQLATPPAELLARQYPQLCPAPVQEVASREIPTAAEVRRPEYTVRTGDTLERIAVIRLGRADRWREILALNHNIVGASGGYLRAGMTLALPDDARTAATVLRPTDRRR